VVLEPIDPVVFGGLHGLEAVAGESAADGASLEIPPAAGFGVGHMAEKVDVADFFLLGCRHQICRAGVQ
jgi:hypothetical protein